MEISAPEPPVKILLIEDNPAELKLMRVFLVKQGFEVDAASDLKTGMQRLAQGDIALTVLDLSLPDSFGLETLVTAHAAAPDVPVVVLTGLDDDRVGLEAISMGAQDFLIKGCFNHEALSRCLRYAIGRKQLERKVRQLNEELEKRVAERTVELSRSNSELKQFAKVAAHDLQEPLRVIQGYVNLLSRRYKGQLDADADEFIEYILDGTDRMVQLIKGVLDHSSIGAHSGDAKLNDSSRALDQALCNLELVIAESGATVTRGHLPYVLVDRLELVQLFQNLISNAIKYRGAETPCVHLSATKVGTDWVFTVEDNGIGIEPRFHDQIFEMFKRLHGKDAYVGTGIGLAICKKIVESHRGRIWIESEPGRGSKFFFSLHDHERVERRAKTSTLLWRNNQ